MADEIEIEVIEKDTQTGIKTKKKIKVTKKEKDGAVLKTGDGDEYSLSGLKKNDPDPPKKDDKTKVSGRYSAPDWATDRDITIVVDCESDPPTIEVIVTYADGKEKGKRDEAHCKKYEIALEECKKVRKFIHELDVPKMAFLGPKLNDDVFVDHWVGPALAAIGSILPSVASALVHSQTEWLTLERRTFALVPSLAGVSILVTREGDELHLTVSASSDAVREMIERTADARGPFTFVTEDDDTSDLHITFTGSGGMLRNPQITPPPQSVTVNGNKITIFWDPPLPKGTPVQVTVDCPFPLEVYRFQWSILV